MTEPIGNEGQITLAWLTERLRQQRHLTRGTISQLSVEHFQTLLSHIYRLQVSYSTDAAHASLPSKLLLKVPRDDNEVSLKMGKDEVTVYRAIMKAMDDPPIARCFDAFYSEDSGRSHLLLEDLSDTHFQPETPLPLSERHCELCVEALAQLHAFWWEHPDLGTEIGQLFDEASLKEVLAQTRDALSGFIDFLGDRLSPHRRRAYERAIVFVESFWGRRLTSAKRNTLIHGDAHLWNFLHPKDPLTGRAFLIDLATSNRIRPPTNDLAYMMALQWFPDRRAMMEDALLRHYHAALLARGVKNYSWEDCHLDYRYSVVTQMFTPVLQWAGKQIPISVWWHNFERISEAYKDLSCAELL
jgi:aminoglycoside phosphotransferase (APT) family kinase protein